MVSLDCNYSKQHILEWNLYSGCRIRINFQFHSKFPRFFALMITKRKLVFYKSRSLVEGKCLVLPSPESQEKVVVLEGSTRPTWSPVHFQLASPDLLNEEAWSCHVLITRSPTGFAAEGRCRVYLHANRWTLRDVNSSTVFWLVFSNPRFRNWTNIEVSTVTRFVSSFLFLN